MLLKASPDRSALQQRWYMALAPYSFTLTHIKGKANLVADALSRTLAYSIAALTISTHQPRLSLLILQSAAKTDLAYRALVKTVESQETADAHGFTWHLGHGLLLNQHDQIWVPDCAIVRHLVLVEEHEPPYVGHRGIAETRKLVLCRWWWPGLPRDVESFVRNCDRCQRNNSPFATHTAPPQMIHAQGPGQVITLDFISGLTPAAKTKHPACLVVTDRFTRQVWLIGCRDHLSAEATVELLLTHVVARNGFPSLIITDRGSQFESTLWTTLWERLGSRVALAASKHPQTDGATERANRTLLAMIRKHLLRRKEL